MSSEKLIRDLFLGFFHREPREGDLAHWGNQLNAGMAIGEMVDKLLATQEHRNIKARAGKLFVAPGHFYSPIVNVDEIRDTFFVEKKKESLPAISISKDDHIAMWQKLLPYLRDIPFPDEQQDDYRYYFKNPAFSYGDGSILHAMLRLLKPRRVVEVGSGYSSACTVDTVEKYLDGDVALSFVEPYPDLLRRLIGEEESAKHQIHECFVQAADPEVFTQLQSGDVLFIDSTHLMKTGSDVCHELFNVLPMLNDGVYVHFHDMFWPFEYGRNWVLEQNRSWNEIYGLHAFLMYNEKFEIVFFNDYFVNHCRDRVESDYPKMLNNSGGSLWLRKKG